LKRALAAATAAALLLLAADRLAASLAWLVCAPLVATASRARSWTEAAVLGAAFALELAMLAHAGWLAEVAEGYFSLSPAAAWPAALVLCAATALPMGALLGLALRAAARPSDAGSIAASAAVWVAWESLTRISFPFYPWIGLAATQADVPTVLQAASLGGSPGLSLVLALAGSALGRAWARLRRSAESEATTPGDLPLALAFVVVLALATLLYGAARLRSSEPVRDPSCSLAAIDASIPSPEVPPDEVLARYVAASRRAASSSPDAIVWPESALPRDPLQDPELLRALRAVSSESRAVLLAGGPRFEFDPSWETRERNSVFRIADDATVETYDKRALVPFAESWPTSLVSRPRWLAAEDVVAGAEPAWLRAGGCRIGILICFEADRPELARELAAGGADAIAIQTNDAELPSSAIGIEVAEARLRAVETGLPVLRAANRGESLAIDRYGRDVARPENGVTRLEVGAREPAPAVRWASPLLALCWVVAVLATARGALRASRT
jgi:apolipoprotein N-acyltransferase